MRLNTKQFQPKHLAFVEMTKSGLDSWKSAKDNTYRKLLSVETTYVSISDLVEKSKYSDSEYNKRYGAAGSIWRSTIGFMSRSWINVNKSYPKEYNFKFGTGIYGDTERLLLVDDIFDWVHRGLPAEKVRSAYDIIVALHKKELTF